MFNSVKNENTVTLSIIYTQEYLDQQFIDTGVKQSIFNQRNIRNLSIDTMTAEQRADLLEIGWSGSSIGNKFGSRIHQYQIGKNYATGKPVPEKGDAVKFDHEPSDEELLQLLSELANEKRRIKLEVAELLPAWRAEHTALKIEEEAKREAAKKVTEQHRKRNAELLEQERVKAVTINWQDDGTALFDLREGISIVSGLEFDNRFGSWSKEVTGIDRRESNGFMYDGSLITDGTQELFKNDYRVFLVAATTGSRKYNTTNYQVVVLEDGKLFKTDVTDNDDKPGWALRMRAGIEELLKVTQVVEQTVSIPTELAQQIFDKLNESTSITALELAETLAKLI